MTATNLPVLQAVLKAVATKCHRKLQNSVFVCVQHLLYSCVDLFKALIALGAKPEHIFLLGKQYSTCEAVTHELKAMGIAVQSLTPLVKLGDYTAVFNHDVSHMWKNVQRHLDQQPVDAVIVLDDGGKCLERIPPELLDQFSVIGIEQTTAGLFNPQVINLPVPFIDVATCAAKVHLESTVVVEAILTKLAGILPQKKPGVACGVIGMGVIGINLAKQLVASGYRVYAYDKNKIGSTSSSMVACDSLAMLIQQADYVFGCTGRDITENLRLDDLVTQDKVFISCTSEDKEFLSVLKRIQSENSDTKTLNPLNDIGWQLPNGAKIRLIKGGFPVNFDDSGESVPGHKIQLTRGLLLCALIQAVTNLPELIKNGIKGRVMLHPQAQKFVVKEWLKTHPSHPFSTQLMNPFDDTDWITLQSGGVFCESTQLKHYFSVLKQNVIYETSE